VLICCKVCGTDKDRARGPLLEPLAEAHGAAVWQLLDTSWAWRTWGQAPTARPAAAAKPLPSGARIAGWASRLLASPEPLRWLTETRGIALDVVRENLIGWDGDSDVLTFPMYSRGELVAFKTREARAGAHTIAWPGAGRAWPLYPEPSDRSWALLVAGELDALRARSVGLPAVSVTLGAGTWRDEWIASLADRNVAVCFDNNEDAYADARAAALAAAGVKVKVLSLRQLGLRTDKGDLSDYLNSGGTADALVRELRRRREVQRDGNG
jgi:hypothetical protein